MNLSMGEMLLIFVLALIVFGPKKLPEIGRQIGKALAEFKRASNEFKSQLEAEMRQIEIEETLKKENEALRPTLLSPEGAVASGSLAPETDLPGAGVSSQAGGPQVDPVSTDPESPSMVSPPVEEASTPSILPPAEASGNNAMAQLAFTNLLSSNTGDGENHPVEPKPASSGAPSDPAAGVVAKSETAQGGNA